MSNATCIEYLLIQLLTRYLFFFNVVYFTFGLLIFSPNSKVPSVLLSPGKSYNKKTSSGRREHDESIPRPWSATRDYHKRKEPDNPEIIEHVVDESVLVFPWQAQMFTTEWGKIVASSCRRTDGGGDGGSDSSSGFAKRNTRGAAAKSRTNVKYKKGGEKYIAEMMSNNAKRIKRLQQNSDNRWKECLPPLPNANDLMKRCSRATSSSSSATSSSAVYTDTTVEEGKMIKAEKRRFMELYGGYKK